MSDKNLIDELKEKILSNPKIILEDTAFMNALVKSQNELLGSNIVDLRDAAMKQLEKRLEKIENTHNDVISMAYENLSGTNQIQRAILKLLESNDFPNFIKKVSTEIKEILNVDHIALVLEAKIVNENVRLLKNLNPITIIVEENSIKNYLSNLGQFGPQTVTLRTSVDNTHQFYQNASSKIMSEALLSLDFNESDIKGLLLLGSCKESKFSPGQGTELLTFFANVFERNMARWLI
tara:strand:+ start:35 stop:742 length:708 start_codon:yes stop_codon:yes gene_type:complete